MNDYKISPELGAYLDKRNAEADELIALRTEVAKLGGWVTDREERISDLLGEILGLREDRTALRDEVARLREALTEARATMRANTERAALSDRSYADHLVALRAEVAAYKEGERLAMERMRVGGAERDATIARLAAGVADLVAALKVARGWIDLAAVSAIADGNEAGRCRAQEVLDNIDAALAKAKGGEM